MGDKAGLPDSQSQRSVQGAHGMVCYALLQSNSLDGCAPSLSVSLAVLRLTGWQPQKPVSPGNRPYRGRLEVDLLGTNQTWGGVW
jgi:hypothetical protein